MPGEAGFCCVGVSVETFNDETEQVWSLALSFRSSFILGLASSAPIPFWGLELPRSILGSVVSSD